MATAQPRIAGACLEDKKGSGLFFGSTSGACCRFEAKANGTAPRPFVITKGHAAIEGVAKRVQLGLRLKRT